jgi:hypothetical protein
MSQKQVQMKVVVTTCDLKKHVCDECLEAVQS